MAATPPVAHDDDDAEDSALAATAAVDCTPSSVAADDSGVHALQLRLEAHALDAAVLVEEVTRSADACDEQELELLLRFLQNDVELPVVEQVALGLIVYVETALAVQDETSDAALVTLLLLDQLMPAIKRRGSTSGDGLRETQKTLLAYFKLATKRLSWETLDEQERAVFLQWCEHVLELIFAESSSDEDNSSDPAERQPVSARNLFVVSIASMLLALHDAIAQRAASPTAANFKVVTLVWKNLTKMSSSFGQVLSSSTFEAATTEDTSSSVTFQVDDMLASVIASLEQCALLLCDQTLSEAKLTATLRFLRLYWRAFQGQLLCFLSVTSEVESSVMALVNVAASLTQLSQSSSARIVPKKIQVEASRLLQMVTVLAERLGGTDLGSVGASTREQVRVLLWHSDDEMVRAILQRRHEEDAPVTSLRRNGGDHRVESPIRMGHLLAVAAFGSTDDNILPAEDPNEEIGGAKILAAAAMLLDRYQSCASHVSLSVLEEPNALFLDSFLNLLLRVSDIEELQLFLIKQLFHPEPSRRFILWNVWKEFLCFGWDEERAGAMLSKLIALAQCEGGLPAPGTHLTPGVQLEVYELIVFLYPEMADPLKRICIGEATQIVDAIFSEGPSHKFTLRVASQLMLLEKLSSVSFLKNYDHPEKEAWISKYLPMCFECCGTVLELLTSSSDLKRDEKQGMMRILDVSLLVVKAILDDSDAQKPDFDEVARMLVPMSSEILTELAKTNPKATANGFGRSHTTPTIMDLKLEREASRTLSRILETSTHVLGKLGYVLKRNQTNQFVVALRDLSNVLEQTPAHEASGVAVIVAWFAKTTLFDVQAADTDKEVVWQLFVRLFRNLSCPPPSGDGATGVKRSAVLPTTFDAFYQFLAHSNVVEYQYRHPSFSVSQMLHESAKAPFSEFLSAQQISKAEVGKACCAEMSSSKHVQQARRRHQKMYCERFPDEQQPDDDSETSKRSRESTDESEPALDYPTDEQRESEGSQPSRKRQKLNAFVSICRRTHQALSSSERSTADAVLRSVTEQELDEATKVLEQLLTKAYCS